MRDLLMTKYNSEMQKEKNRIKKLLAYKFIKGRTMFPFMSLAVSARLLWQALLEKLGDESFSFLRFFCFWSSCMAAGASGSVSDGKSERERQEGVGSMALPEPWRPDWETETCIIMGCSWGLTGEHGTFKITCLYAFHTVRAVPRLLLISIFRAKTSVNEGTEGPSYKKKRTILQLPHFIIKFLWPCGLFSNIQVICSGVFLNRGCFSPSQKMSTDGDGFSSADIPAWESVPTFFVLNKSGTLTRWCDHRLHADMQNWLTGENLT